LFSGKNPVSGLLNPLQKTGRFFAVRWGFAETFILRNIVVLFPLDKTSETGGRDLTYPAQGFGCRIFWN